MFAKISNWTDFRRFYRFKLLALLLFWS